MLNSVRQHNCFITQGSYIGLSFTLEWEQENKLNFLDLSIIKTTNKISFDIYRKPTTSDIIIPNDSRHPLEEKLSAIRYFTDRINTYDLDHTRKRIETDKVKQIIRDNKFDTDILKRVNSGNPMQLPCVIKQLC